MKRDYICTARLREGTFGNGKTYLKPVRRSTEKGLSAYANKMYNKYGENVIVEVGYFDDECNWKEYTTYSA